jgi:beta-ureidopropionase
MSDAFTIALAQFASGEDREANRVKGEKMVAEAAAKGASLVAFPEMAFEPFFPQHPTAPRYFDWAETVPGPTSQRFAEAALDNSVAVFINLLQRMERGQYFDSTVALSADGRIGGFSHMMHICETPGFHEKYYYWPGQTGFPVFDMGTAVIAPCICYDRHYPEVMRIFTLKGAEIIIVQTATTREEAGTVLEAEMRAAALANGVFVALVNKAGRDGALDFAGRSFVVDPGGEIIAQSTKDGDDLLVVELELERISHARHAWPFLRDRRPELYEALFTELGDAHHHHDHEE